MVLPNVSVICIVCLALSPTGYASEMGRVLDAVSWAESKGVPTTGDGGRSVSSYQIFDITWRHISEMRQSRGLPVFPHSRHGSEVVAREYAKTYLEWLTQMHEKHRMAKPTPEVLYLMYTMGWSAARSIGFNTARAPAYKQRGVKRFLEKYNE